MTIKQLEDLKAKGKIRGFSLERVEKKAPSTKRGHKIKDWIDLNLKVWAEANGLELKREFQFTPERRWRYDWAIPEKKIAFEYEGLCSEKNGHTSKQGYTSNTEKYNEGAAQGWKVIRYTYLNYKDLLKDLNKLF